MNIIKDQSLTDRGYNVGIVIVNYPEPSEWNAEEFYKLADSVVSELQAEVAARGEYDRKAAWGDNIYFKFFKKFKKTYPVLLQYESFAVKGRPFPRYNPVVEVPFLAEVRTMVLSGCHDIDKVVGDFVLYAPEEKEDFMGLRGEVIHTYPNETAGRDDAGIVLSMNAGADDRTCGTEESRNVFYPLFGMPGQDVEELNRAAEIIEEYVKVLAPTAKVSYELY